MKYSLESLRSSRNTITDQLKSLLGICFDLDGVLIDSMPLHARAWQEAVRVRGLRLDKRLIYTWEGEPGMITARRVLAGNGDGAPSDLAVEALLADKERRFKTLAAQLQVDQRLQRLLKALQKASIRLGLVTGTSARELPRVVPTRILARFQVIVTGDRVAHGKPHPEPYLIAFQRLRLAPTRAIVVENAPYGIQAARSAGAGVIVALASSLPKRFLTDADLVVTTIDQLCDTLRTLVCLD